MNPDAKSSVLVEVPPGSSFRQASKILEEQGLVRKWWILDILSRIKGKNTIHAGEYELSPAMRSDQILEMLLSGKVFMRKIVFKEGQTISELGGLVEASGLLTRLEINQALQDAELISKSGIESNSFEGYLFPNTYLFSRPTEAKDVITAMIVEGEKRWKKGYDERTKGIGMTRHEVLTFASIVEKESGNAEEQPTIASVFYNRLNAKWPLQSDPTAVYGLPGFKGPIRRKHLEIDSPYNTYKIRGLPPGPICNPGESAIRAVLYPADTTYMYFVADAEGGHIFSANQKEHERAVEFYRRRKALGIKAVESLGIAEVETETPVADSGQNDSMETSQ